MTNPLVAYLDRIDPIPKDTENFFLRSIRERRVNHPITYRLRMIGFGAKCRAKRLNENYSPIWIVRRQRARVLLADLHFEKHGILLTSHVMDPNDESPYAKERWEYVEKLDERIDWASSAFSNARLAQGGTGLYSWSDAWARAIDKPKIVCEDTCGVAFDSMEKYIDHDCEPMTEEVYNKKQEQRLRSELSMKRFAAECAIQKAVRLGIETGIIPKEVQ